MAEAVSGDLPPGWHRPTLQHSSPLTSPSRCCSLSLSLCLVGHCHSCPLVLPGHLPDPRSGPKRGQDTKLDGRTACNSHGHWHQVDEGAEKLDPE